MTLKLPTTGHLRALAICVGASTVAACGLSTDERTVEIPANELPTELGLTTTTTTTTTTTVPAPPETVATTAPQTTNPVDAPPPADMYYPTAGTGSEMYAYRIAENPPANLDDLVTAMSKPPNAALALGLRSAVMPGMIVEHTLDRGTLFVDLDPELYESLLESQRRRAVAQMVLTFTGFTPPGEGGIGLVAFSVGGQPVSVIIPQVGTAAAGEGLTFADFKSLIADFDTPGQASETTAAAPDGTDTPASTSASSVPTSG